MNGKADTKVKDIDWRKILPERMATALSRLGLHEQPDITVPGAVWRTDCDQCGQPLYYASLDQEPRDVDCNIFCDSCVADFWQAVRDRQKLSEET